MRLALLGGLVGWGLARLRQRCGKGLARLWQGFGKGLARVWRGPLPTHHHRAKLWETHVLTVPGQILMRISFYTTSRPDYHADWAKKLSKTKFRENPESSERKEKRIFFFSCSEDFWQKSAFGKASADGGALRKALAKPLPNPCQTLAGPLPGPRQTLAKCHVRPPIVAFTAAACPIVALIVAPAIVAIDAGCCYRRRLLLSTLVVAFAIVVADRLLLSQTNRVLRQSKKEKIRTPCGS